MFVRTIYSCMSMTEPLLERRSCCARVEGGEGAAACHTIDAYLEIGRYGRHGLYTAAGHCSLLTVHRPLPATHCPLSAAHRPLPTAHCPLPTAHCPLSGR